MTQSQLVDKAVAERFLQLGEIRRCEGSFDYHGPSTKPNKLGWRFRQRLGLRGVHDDMKLEAAVRHGEHDELIRETYHDAAAADFYYGKEKKW